MCVVGALVSAVWFIVQGHFKNLNSVKFELIQELEQGLPVRFYSAEWARLGEGDGSRYTSISTYLRFLPAIPFVAFLVLAFLRR